MSTSDPPRPTDTDPPPSPTRLELNTRTHQGFFLRHLRLLPRPYQSGDEQRMTLAFFCLSALDLLGGKEGVNGKLGEEERRSYREWIWGLEVGEGGFRGSPALGQAGPSSETLDSSGRNLISGHLAMTYTALLNLAILRDDFTRLNRPGLQRLLQQCQLPNGSFSASPTSSSSEESDPRFTFCAFAICYMLDDWTSIDVERALDFLDSCKSYDGAYGQGPHQESQGGSTYCCLASYSLSQSLDRRLPPIARRRVTQWLLNRQSEGTEDDEEETVPGGFNGRIGKVKDSCYSFWCGASLKILDAHHLFSNKANVIHLLCLQTKIGGIPKTEDDPPDAMHSYLSLAALAIHASKDATTDDDDDWKTRCGLITTFESGLDPRLNCSGRTAQWLLDHLRTRSGS